MRIYLNSRETSEALTSKRFSLKNVIFSSRLGEKVKCQWPALGTARAQSCLKIGPLAKVFKFIPVIPEFQIKSTYFPQEQILDF